MTVTEQRLLPAAPVQEQMWLVDRMDPEASVYNESLAFVLTGALDHAAFNHAWTLMVGRHQALRTILPVVDGELFQEIVDEAHIPVVRSSAPTMADAEEWACAVVEEPYDAAAAPPVRIALCGVGDGEAAAAEHLLAIGFHHGVMDAASVAVLMRELGEAYDAIARREEPAMSPVTAEYADYVLWHRDLLDSGMLEAEADRWSEELSAMPAYVEVPPDRTRAGAKSLRGSIASVRLRPGLVPAVKGLAIQTLATPFQCLLAAMTLVVHRESQQRDFVLGIGSAGRPEGYEDAVGPFSCMLPVQLGVPMGATFRDLVAVARDAALATVDRQFIPFRRVVEGALDHRDASRTPVVQIVFNAPPLVFAEDCFGSGLRLGSAFLPRNRARFDFLINLEWAGDDFVAGVEYDSTIYDEATVRRLVGELDEVLAAAVAAPDRPVADIPLGAPVEPRPATALPLQMGGPWHPAADESTAMVMGVGRGPAPVAVAAVALAADRTMGEVVAATSAVSVVQPCGAPASRGLRGELAVGGSAVRAVVCGDRASVVSRAWWSDDDRLLVAIDGLTDDADDAGGGVGGRDGEVPNRHAVERAVVAACREVLEDDRVTGDDDFFAAGGHSMVASRLMQSLSEEFGEELPLVLVFDFPVLRDLAGALARRHPDVAEALAAVDDLDDAELSSLAAPLDLVGVALLSDGAGTSAEPAESTMLLVAEEEFWLLEQFAPGTSLNALTLQVEVRGALNLGALEWALGELQRRHEVLRTRFVSGAGGTPERDVDRAGPRPQIDVLDLQSVAAGEERRAALARAADKQARGGYRIDALPLWQVRAVLMSPDTTVLLFSFHHIVMDYWSVTRVLLPELGALYAFRTGAAPEPELAAPAPLSTVAAAQRRWIASDAFQQEVSYWRETLRDMQPLSLPLDSLRSDRPSLEGASVEAVVDAELVAALREFTLRERVTLFAAVSGALARVAADWSGQDDVQVLTPCENRRDMREARTMGAFVNLVVLRFDLASVAGGASSDGDGWASALVRHAQDVVRGAYVHQSLPSAEIFRLSGAGAFAPAAAWSTVALNLFDATGLVIPGCDVGAGRIVPTPAAGSDLELSVLPEGDTLVLELKYRSAIWQQRRAGRFVADLVATLRRMAATV